MPGLPNWGRASLSASTRNPAVSVFDSYGDKALEETLARADELAAAGDDNGAATWRQITNAVVQLANQTPPGPVH